MGSADLRSFDSRQSPVAQDDNLWRGDFAPRGLLAKVAEIAKNRVIAKIENQTLALISTNEN